MQHFFASAAKADEDECVTRHQYILYAVLLVPLAILSEWQGAPRGLNIYEFWNLIAR
jgi:hypothetical protein